MEAQLRYKGDKLLWSDTTTVSEKKVREALEAQT